MIENAGGFIHPHYLDYRPRFTSLSSSRCIRKLNRLPIVFTAVCQILADCEQVIRRAAPPRAFSADWSVCRPKAACRNC